MTLPTSTEPRTSAGCTAFRLRRLSRRVSQHYDAHLAGAGLRSTQFSLLGALVRRDGPALTRLADVLAMDRTTLTRNLRPLVVAGLVRMDTGEDARSRLVAITPAGRERWQQAYPLWEQAQHTLHEILGAEDVGRLHGALDGALASLKAVPGA